MTSKSKYDELVRRLSGTAGVTHVTKGGGFGSSGQLKAGGRIFAMLVRGELVLKLPRTRIDQLVEHGEGRRFDAGKGTPMREWFVLSASSSSPWLPLAQEAMDFVKEKG